MLKHNVHLIVVMDDKKIKGMIRSLDFVKLVAEHSVRSIQFSVLKAKAKNHYFNSLINFLISLFLNKPPKVTSLICK